jgi:hypothetical protein
MKKLLIMLSLAYLIYPNFSYAQRRGKNTNLEKVNDSLMKEAADSLQSSAINSAGSGKAVKDKTSEKTAEINPRVSFIAGLGASTFFRSLYVDPIVNPTNNLVQLQFADKLKSNVTLGIAYTPFLYDIITVKSTFDKDGNIVTREDVTTGVPKGLTFAAFINPVALSKISENQTFFNSPDFGAGIGYRGAGGLSVFFTAEAFWVQQPRDWFVKQFKDGNAAYLVDGAPQKTIDLKNNNIFVSKPVITFGFKLAFTFDIIKSFTSSVSTTFTTTPASSSPGTTPPARATSDSTGTTAPPTRTDSSGNNRRE